MDYQTFRQYDGGLYGNTRYRGMEYSQQVPDHLIVGSPGGVSSTHHHYTGGFYGRGGNSLDIYAGQGYRYPSAEFGSLYEVGHSAPQQQGYYQDAPDNEYWQNDSHMTAGETEDFELIEPADIDEPGNTSTQGGHVAKWVAIFLLALLAFMAFDFWSKTSKGLLQEHLFKGEMKWYQYAIFAVAITLVFALFLWLLGSTATS